MLRGTISPMKRVVLWMGLLAAAILVACSGRGVGPQPFNVLPQSADTTNAMMAASTCTKTPVPTGEGVGYGQINGCDDQFTPSNDVSSGNQPVPYPGGTLPCAPSMITNKYHVHAFVGIIVNGKQIALADGAGMYKPQGDFTFTPPPGQTWKPIPNWTEYANCYYQLHTHDASGVVHIEDGNFAQAPFTSHFMLGTFFDVWKQTLSTTQIGPFIAPSGTTVHAYVAQPKTVVGTIPNQCPSTSRCPYIAYNGNPRSIPLESHTTIWLVIGAPPASFPPIVYNTEY